MNRKAVLPFCVYWVVCEIEPFPLYIDKGIAAREIIKVPFEKADSGDYFAVFPPLSPQFLERLER